MTLALALLATTAFAGEPISLQAAMDQAAASAVAVRAAETDVSAADARVVQARSASLPTLTAQAGIQVWDRALSFSFSGDSGDSGTSSLDCSAIPAPFDSLCSSLGEPTQIRDQVTGSVTLRAVQPLTSLASSIPGLRAAARAQDAAEAAVEAARVNARYQAADAWLAAMEADAQLEI
ncbi:MAG TPA: TolC family protein, partial [Myxococcota bacterium]|nr:TolC family protein [Myxococcota bacterium]